MWKVVRSSFVRLSQKSPMARASRPTTSARILAISVTMVASMHDSSQASNSVATSVDVVEVAARTGFGKASADRKGGAPRISGISRAGGTPSNASARFCSARAKVSSEENERATPLERRTKTNVRATQENDKKTDYANQHSAEDNRRTVIVSHAGARSNETSEGRQRRRGSGWRPPRTVAVEQLGDAAHEEGERVRVVDEPPQNEIVLRELQQSGTSNDVKEDTEKKLLDFSLSRTFLSPVLNNLLACATHSNTKGQCAGE